MKSSQILLVTLAGAFGAATMNAQASPRAAEASGSHYLVAADNLSGWHLGGFYRHADREVDGGARAFKQNKFILHVGRDLLSWLSVYGFMGTTSAEIEPTFGGSTDQALEYGGGVWASLLDHDLLNNLALETRLRLQALAQVSASSPEVQGEDMSYTEVYASMTLSIVNELIGNKNYWPEAIGLFFGPVYDEISCDEVNLTGGNFGLTGGLDIYLSRDITMSLSFEAVDSDNIMNLALNYRF